MFTLFLSSCLAVLISLRNVELSAILTLSTMAHLLAMSFVSLQLMSEGAETISVKSLALHVLGAAARLCSTLHCGGYLPVDWTDNRLYQAFDVVALGLAFTSFSFAVISPHQNEEDSVKVTLQAILAGAAAVAIAAASHADMASDPLFDTLWLASLLIGGVAVLPQFWLCARIDYVSDYMAHSIASSVLSQMFSGIYVWHVRKHMTSRLWWKDVNVSVLVMLASHLPPLAMVPDFSAACI